MIDLREKCRDEASPTLALEKDDDRTVERGAEARRPGLQDCCVAAALPCATAVQTCRGVDSNEEEVFALLTTRHGDRDVDLIADKISVVAAVTPCNKLCKRDSAMNGEWRRSTLAVACNAMMATPSWQNKDHTSKGTVAIKTCWMIIHKPPPRSRC